MTNFFEKTTNPKEVKIFGHKIYGTDIYEIEWNHTKYGLKKSRSNNPYEIKFSVSFESTIYNLNLSINTIEFWKTNFAYNEFPHKEEIEKVKKELGKKIIKDIKENIE